MFETCISILDNNGVYPKETVLCDELGFSCYKGFPLWFRVFDLRDKYQKNYKYHEKPTILKASFLITHRKFPAYNFPLNSTKCTIYISSKTKPNLKNTFKRVKLIMKGAVKPTILYGAIKSTNFEKRRAKIAAIRSKPEYIDLYHCKRKPFMKLLDDWRGSYTFSLHRCSLEGVKKYYELFSQCSRFIHIALYYYNNAANLTLENHIEDAGINLQLTVEAIIRDYMELHSVKNKRKAIESFISNVWPPKWGTDYLDDLYKSRNQLLAHIDEDMFTENQSIRDPDMYCYDTFKSITFLITRYIRYKNRLLENSS